MNKTNTKTGVRNDDGGILEAILGETKPTPEASLQLADPSLLSYYTQRANRTVWITGEVGEDIMVYEQMILAWNLEDQMAGKKREERKPIILFVTGPGGDLYSALSFCNCIEMSETPVYTVNCGYCFSADALIFISGHRRFAFKDSSCLFHLGSGSSNANFADAQESNKQWKKLVERMKEIICEKTTISKALLTRKTKADWYLMGKEQLEHGVCDEIVESVNQIL